MKSEERGARSGGEGSALAHVFMYRKPFDVGYQQYGLTRICKALPIKVPIARDLLTHEDRRIKEYNFLRLSIIEFATPLLA